MKFLLICIILLLALNTGCKSPLDNNPTNGDVFTLTVDYDQNYRITNMMLIDLSWSDITIENFKQIQVSRLNKHRDPLSYPANITEDGWITILNTDNAFTTSYIDTISDDAEFLYRVDYIDSDNNYKRAEKTIKIRQTTHLTVPTDEKNIKTAVESYLIDDGDSVLVYPGEYNTNSFSFNNKNISLIGTSGAVNTFLNWIPRMASVEPLPDTTFINITDGLIQGISITGAYVMNGGAINATGNAKIQNCRIKENTAHHVALGGQHIIGAGYGGGLYLSGNAQVVNCVVDSNFSSKSGNGIYIDEFANDVSIVNCVLYANNLSSNSSDVSVLNTIITAVANPIDIVGFEQLNVTYSHVGNEWHNFDPSNIVGEILFALPGTDYHLLPGSVCINTGDPDPIYNDIDGSRSDLGAYGGPQSNW